jgi:glycosyltransferase involved in cell wall biosynthesis
MMRVAIICKTFLKGGAEKQALILTKLLVEKGISAILVNWYGEKVDQRNLKFISDNSLSYFPMSGSYFQKLKKFQKIIKEEETSIILSYLTLANFVSGISKILHRNIVTIGGIRNEKLPYYKFIFEKLIHNYLNDATVFNNYSAKEKFENKGFNPEKIYVIQNAIDAASLNLNQKNSNGEIKIVTVGRFVKQKDYGTSLRSFSNLVGRNKDKEFKYYIVGYGPLEKEVRSMAEQLKIEKNIKIFINPADVTGILKSGDIFLSTSLFEGVSNSIMEALVAGLPVVATNVGDNSYLVKNGQNGYLVPCKDVDTIVDKLEYLSGSQEIRREFGKNSIKVVETDFSKNKLLDSYLELFSKLL